MLHSTLVGIASYSSSRTCVLYLNLLSYSSFFILKSSLPLRSIFFFFNDTATTEIYTLSLHDALPISGAAPRRARPRDQSRIAAGHRHRASRHGLWREQGRRHLPHQTDRGRLRERLDRLQDRKSTRLNSSHTVISYAVFCLKKKQLSRDQNSASAAVLDPEERKVPQARRVSDLRQGLTRKTQDVVL